MLHLHLRYTYLLSISVLALPLLLCSTCQSCFFEYIPKCVATSQPIYCCITGTALPDLLELTIFNTTMPPNRTASAILRDKSWKNYHNHDVRPWSWKYTEGSKNVLIQGDVCIFSCFSGHGYHYLSSGQACYQYYGGGSKPVPGVYSCVECADYTFQKFRKSLESRQTWLLGKLGRRSDESVDFGDPAAWRLQYAGGYQFASTSRLDICMFTGEPMPNQKEAQSLLSDKAVMCCRACYSTRVMGETPSGKLLSCTFDPSRMDEPKKWLESAFPTGLQSAKADVTGTGDAVKPEEAKADVTGSGDAGQPEEMVDHNILLAYLDEMLKEIKSEPDSRSSEERH